MGIDICATSPTRLPEFHVTLASSPDLPDIRATLAPPPGLPNMHVASTSHSTLPDTYPESTALLLIGCQEAHLNLMESTLDQELFLRKAALLLTKARENQLTVIHCPVNTAFGPGYIHTDWDWARMKNKQNPSTHSPFCPGLEPACCSKLADRGHEGISPIGNGKLAALTNKTLARLLSDRLKVSHLILCGMPTCHYVLGTALHACKLGFTVTVIDGGVWDPKMGYDTAAIFQVLPAKGRVEHFPVVIRRMMRNQAPSTRSTT
jgi:nicotinamidase-related amidase